MPAALDHQAQAVLAGEIDGGGNVAGMARLDGVGARRGRPGIPSSRCHPAGRRSSRDCRRSCAPRRRRRSQARRRSLGTAPVPRSAGRRRCPSAWPSWRHLAKPHQGGVRGARPAWPVDGLALPRSRMAACRPRLPPATTGTLFFSRQPRNRLRNAGKLTKGHRRRQSQCGEAGAAWGEPGGAEAVSRTC